MNLANSPMIDGSQQSISVIGLSCRLKKFRIASYAILNSRILIDDRTVKGVESQCANSVASIGSASQSTATTIECAHAKTVWNSYTIRLLTPLLLLCKIKRVVLIRYNLEVKTLFHPRVNWRKGKVHIKTCWGCNKRTHGSCLSQADSTHLRKDTSVQVALGTLIASI